MWQAREDYWNYIKDLLESSVGSTSLSNQKTDHSAVSKAIEEFSKNVPDSAYYFAFIFVYGEQSSDPARGLAGLLFKNKLRASIDCLDETQVEALVGSIKGPLIALLSNTENHSSFIQRTVGSILSTLLTDCNGLVIWPQLLQELVALCGKGSLYAFSAIERICEDAAFELIEHPQIFEPFLNFILTFLTRHDQYNDRITNSLLTTVAHLIPTQSALLTDNIDFIVGVTEESKSEHDRLTACKLLSILIEFYWTLLKVDQIQRIFNIILQWTLESSSSESSESRQLLKQCLEFWLFQVQTDYTVELFQCAPPALLSCLIPLLVDLCAYDEEEDEEELCRALEDLNVPDEEEELKPRHHKGKYDKGDSDPDRDTDSDLESVVTSLRKCAAATLDGLSLAIPNPARFLQIFLPAFNDRVGSNDWKVREGSLLAFGAIVESLWSHLSPHLNQIVSFLLANAHTHPHPLVRSMSLWTLSRVSNWLHSSDPSNTQLPESFKILIGSLSDANKRVQQSAATSLCKFLEEATTPLPVDYCKSLISAIFLALKCYQKRSLLILYDLIRVFATSPVQDNLISFDLEARQYWRSIAIILIDRINPESVSDSSIFPVIEALMSLLLGDLEGNLLDPSKRDEMHFKALNLAAQNLSALTPELSGETIVDEGLDDFLIAALDLLASAVESSKLIPSDHLLPMLRKVLAASLLFTESSNVRQSAFALFGDYAALPEAQKVFDSSLNTAYHLALHQNLLPSTLNSQETKLTTSMATATNALWSLGEYCLIQAPTQSFDELTLVLFSLLKDRPTLEVGARIYFENLAVCLGRLLRSSTNHNTTTINITNTTFLTRVFNLLTTVESGLERSSAIAGYLRFIRLHPNQITTKDYQSVIIKINELIDFSSSNLNDQILKQNLTGFSHESIDSSFYHSLQLNFRTVLLQR